MKSRIRLQQREVPFSKTETLDIQRLNQMFQGGVKGGLRGEELGVYGLLRQVASEYSARPVELLSSAERMAAMRQFWAGQARERKTACLAYKLIFHLDPEFEHGMAAGKVPADETFTGIVVGSLRLYQQKFFPGQQLGYLLSIRSVRGKKQAWVLLYPASEQGWAAMLSPEAKLTTSAGKLVSVKHANFIRDSALKAANAIYHKKLSNPVRNFRCNDPDQEQLLTQIAYSQLEKAGKTGDDLAKFLPDQRTRLVHLPEVDIRPLLKDGYEASLRIWTAIDLAKAKSNIEKATGFLSLLASKLKAETEKSSQVFARSIEEIRKSGSASSYFPTANRIPLGTRTYRLTLPTISRWIDEQLLEPWGTRKPLGEVVEQARLDVLAILPQSAHSPSSLDSLDRFLSARRIIQGRLLALKIILDDRLRTARALIKKAMIGKRDKVERVRRLRLLLHLPYLGISLSMAKIRGNQPQFLREYDRWQFRTQPIPVRISRQVPGDPESLRERSRRRRDGLREVKPLAIGETVSNPLYHYHTLSSITSPSAPLLTESVFNQDLTGRGPNSVTSEIDEDRTPQEILDSPVEKEILSLIGSNSAAFRDMLRTYVNRCIDRSSVQQVLDENAPDEFIKAGL